MEPCPICLYVAGRAAALSRSSADGATDLHPKKASPTAIPCAALPISRSPLDISRRRRLAGRELGTFSTTLKKLSDTTNQITRNLKCKDP